MDAKKHKCMENGCDYSTNRKSSLTSHLQNKHDIGVAWKICKYCGMKFKQNSGLNRHIRTLHEIKNIIHCPYDNCPFTTKRSKSDLKKHINEVHESDKATWTHCPEEGCTYKCYRKRALKLHLMNIHDIDVVWHKCAFPLCGYRTKLKCSLTRHNKRLHSKEGIQRHKRKEEAINKLLNKNDISNDRELRINFKCFKESKTCAFIDFVIYKSTHTILLEVDEDQHKYSNTISCDVRRMMDSISAIRIGGNELPLLFIRYNPDSYKINGIMQKTLKKDREETLIKFINNYIPEKQLEIKYMFYDMHDNKPSITFSSEYSKDIKKCII